MDSNQEERIVGALENIAEDMAEIKWALQGICNNIALLNSGKETGEECMYQFPKVKKEEK